MRVVLFLVSLLFAVAKGGTSVFTVDSQASPTPFPHVWEECVGSGHAVLALRKDYQDYLRQCREELGFKGVRFHGIFDDDMSVFMLDANGNPTYSWFNVDQVFDFLVSIKMQPYVEISFMPEDLASGTETIMHYKGNVTPPKNYTLWDNLVKEFATHLVARYGIDEIGRWSFEVWNEPNCGFFSGNQSQYFYHYAHTATALKSVSSKIRVGGPVTCGSAWIPEFINYCNTNKIPYDFIATHEYPTDLNPIKKDMLTGVFQKARQQAGNNTPLYYSEFNDGLYSNPAYHDTPYASAFFFYAMGATRNIVDLLSWWTFSDIFEEGGQTSVPFFTADGWGLLNIYQIPKPVYRAFEILHNVGTEYVSVSGVNPNATVGAYAILNDDPGMNVILYNFDIPSNPVVNETVLLNITNIKTPPSYGTIMRIDDTHANAPAQWVAMGSPMYPSRTQITQLKESSELKLEKITPTQMGENYMVFELVLPKWGSAVISIDF